ncbi:unnamed protein product [Haemonchus placei]|uniref:WD_REPEATS_REGION domain-containing protein n=1 Tax=Haemonchus placei TaxID=6290 RepID=A0A0N4W7X1_HAEPC|nr:unnamed protein product [Haemonchus placei]
MAVLDNDKLRKPGLPGFPWQSDCLHESPDLLRAILNHALSQPKEELKTHFTTREGSYKLMTMAEYSRPNRVPMNQVIQPGTANVAGAPVRVSFLSLNGINKSPSPRTEEQDDFDCDENYREDLATADRICFNVGRELYVYLYKGIHTAADLSKPIDKRVYKGTYPTCHHFNQETATSTNCSLIIGFSAGQIQLIDPFHKEYQASRLYNEERFIDKTGVTCLRWVPGQKQHFLVSYSSGYMYLYNEELQCPLAPPVYQAFKQGDKYSVCMCKAKTTRNPVYRWQIGEGGINQFAFSGPDAKMLATVGHDGYLRIFNYHQMELLSYMKSYFGGLLTLAWSPDAKLIVTGGEDDLLTVYNVHEKRVVCRGQGHKSWISQPANVQRHRNSTIIAPMLGLEIQVLILFSLYTDPSLTTAALDEAKLLGTRVCPRMEDVPVIEPLICKKIAHERLTVLEFRKDCLVTACQEGFICTWARPGKVPNNLVKRDVNSPNTLSSPTGLRDGVVPATWSNVTSAQAH